MGVFKISKKNWSNIWTIFNWFTAYQEFLLSFLGEPDQHIGLFLDYISMGANFIFTYAFCRYYSYQF